MPLFEHGRFYVPFQKVDRERRIVWGVAQTEDPDTQGDLVTYEASVEAFKKWAGNVREMHDPVAVGKAVQIVCDPVAKQIHVGTYISKGAEDTWQKVLDGTLRGYSIGGRAIDATMAFVKSLGRSVRKITKYVLDELSLVDTPANSLCVITAVQKRGSMLVATDVLGRLTSDVTSHSQGVERMKTLKKRVKAQPLVKFTQGLDEKDGVIVARVSDFVKDDKSGNFILKSAAPIAQLSKGDLEADGYTDAGNEEQDDVPVVDFGGHAENAALMHRDLCKMAGIDDPDAHYAQVTGGGDDDQLPVDDQDPDQGAGLDKGRGIRRRRATRNSVDIAAIVKNAVTEATTTLAKSFDAKLEAIGGAAAPRKGGEPGTVVERQDPATAGDALQKGANGDDSPLAKIEKELETLYSQRDEILSKRAGKVSDEDRRAGESLAKRIGQLETARDTIRATTSAQ